MQIFAWSQSRHSFRDLGATCSQVSGNAAHLQGDRRSSTLLRLASLSYFVEQLWHAAPSSGGFGRPWVLPWARTQSFSIVMGGRDAEAVQIARAQRTVEDSVCCSFTHTESLRKICAVVHS
eukprot:1175834-Amphidinium_carterae.1